MSDSHRRDSEELLAELRRALDGDTTGSTGNYARLDVHRQTRLGTPEIILAENKSIEQVLALATKMLDHRGRVLISRVNSELRERLCEQFRDQVIEQPAGANLIRISKRDSDEPEVLGAISIFTAGTSDLPRAEEARVVAEEMGCTVTVWADVGVAGLHRLIQPFKETIDSGAGAIIVVAGMDGALPSVIAGLSPIPVIGLPTSVGYGYGGNGEAALMSMLQTCAPGLTVVNIDNSVGAAVAAARIAIASSSDTQH